MNERAKIELVAQPGHVELTVNGENLTRQVASVMFEAAAGDLPRMGVVFKEPAFSFEGEGVVHVQQPVEVAPADVIVAFLDSIDPEQLQELVLTEGDFATPPGVAFLSVLRKMAASVGT